MLAVLLVIIVHTGEFDCTSVGDLGSPFVLVGHAVDIDSTAVVSEVEAAVLGIETADFTLEPEELTLGRLLDKGADVCERELGIVNLRSLGLTVDGNKLAAGCIFRSLSLEIHESSVDHYLVSDFELVLGGEGDTFEILTPVDLKLDSTGTIGGNEIGGVSVARINVDTDHLSSGIDIR